MNISVILFYLIRAVTLAIAVGALWSAYSIIIKKKSPKNKEFVLGLITVCYLTALIQITVIRDYGGFFDFSDNVYSSQSVQYIPFKTMLRAYRYSVWEFTYHVVGNIAWFLPFGMLFSRRHGFIKVAAGGFFLSLSIELLQLIFNTGVSDIDDLITNTVGAVIGYIIAAIASCKTDEKCE